MGDEASTGGGIHRGADARVRHPPVSRPVVLGRVAAATAERATDGGDLVNRQVRVHGRGQIARMVAHFIDGADQQRTPFRRHGGGEAFIPRLEISGAGGDGDGPRALLEWLHHFGRGRT